MKLIKLLVMILILASLTACTDKKMYEGRWYMIMSYPESATLEEKNEAKANLELMKVLGMDAVADFRENGTGRIYFTPETSIDTYITDFEYNAFTKTIKMIRNVNGDKQVSYGKLKLETDKLIISYNDHIMELSREPIQVTDNYEEIVNQIMTADILDDDNEPKDSDSQIEVEENKNEEKQ